MRGARIAFVVSIVASGACAGLLDLDDVAYLPAADASAGDARAPDATGDAVPDSAPNEAGDAGFDLDADLCPDGVTMGVEIVDADPNATTDCGGIPVQLGSNANHCGACGHGCRSSPTCSGFVCQPEHVYDGDGGTILGMGNVVGGDVFFTDDRRALSVGTDGGPITEWLDAGGNGLTFADPARVFVLVGTSIVALPRDGGASVLVYQGGAPFDLGESPTHLYVPGTGAPSWIDEALKNGGDAGRIVNAADAPRRVRYDSSQIFWLTNAGTDAGAIAYYDLPTKAGPYTSGPIPGASVLGVSGPYLYYYADAPVRELRRLPRNSLAAAPQTLARFEEVDNARYGHQIIVDSDDVFVATGRDDNNNNERFYKVPKCGGVPRALVKSYFNTIATDAEYAYFVSGSSVVKTPKR